MVSTSRLRLNGMRENENTSSDSDGEYIDEIEGKIINCDKEKVFIKIFDWRSARTLSVDELYTMKFLVNEKIYQTQKDALQLLTQHNLFDILINNSIYRTNARQSIYYPSRHQHNSSSIDNQYERMLSADQKIAVDNIVNGNHYPVPYLLQGFSGELFLIFLIVTLTIKI